MSVEESDRLKLDKRDVPRRADKPMPGGNEAICSQAQDREVRCTEEQTNNASDDYIKPYWRMAAALARGGPVT